MRRTLILGGVRSGKSRYAERVAQLSGAPVTVIVTAAAGDEEMAARIAAHRARRPAEWRVREAPVELGSAIEQASYPDTVVIVDCLTLWLSNVMALGDATVLEREREALKHALSQASGAILLVSNEVGMGVVPINELARRFIDQAGTLHQQLGGLCDEVVWMIAGIPTFVKRGAA
jgi:adenosylcobinamide kinase / adenosylcobinamide-phosphate guanylyltransferase